RNVRLTASNSPHYIRNENSSPSFFSLARCEAWEGFRVETSSSVSTDHALSTPFCQPHSHANGRSYLSRFSARILAQTSWPASFFVKPGSCVRWMRANRENYGRKRLGFGRRGTSVRRIVCKIRAGRRTGLRLPKSIARKLPVARSGYDRPCPKIFE